MDQFVVAELCGGQVLDVPQEFPYLVIEYFKDDLRKPPSDIKLHITAQDRIASKLKSRYCKTNDSMEATPIVLDAQDNRVFHGRWEHICLIVIVQQSKTQTYFSESLNHAHYSLHPLEYKSYISLLKSFQKQNHGQPP